jgi:hypothetical protein
VVITTESKSVSLDGTGSKPSCKMLFFPIRIRFEIHSWIVSSPPHHNFVLAKMIPTTESKSAS